MLSLRGYARHRASQKLPGQSLAAIQRAIREGRIKPDVSGKIDPAAADQAWMSNTRRTVAESRRQERAATPAGSKAPASRPVRDSGGATLAKAQLAHEIARAKKTALQAGLLEGSLVNAHDVEVSLAGHVTAARNRLLMAPDAAGICEDCRKIVKSAICQALTELAAYRPGAPEGGSGGSHGPA